MIEDELPLFPGVLTFLKAASRHFSLGLVSMANKPEVGYVFERANLTPLFSVVVTAEDVSVCKPAPDCYLAGLKKLNEKRQHERSCRCCRRVFSDRRFAAGIQSARAAGMRTLELLTPFRPKRFAPPALTLSPGAWLIGPSMR